LFAPQKKRDVPAVIPATAGTHTGFVAICDDDRLDHRLPAPDCPGVPARHVARRHPWPAQCRPRAQPVRATRTPGQSGAGVVPCVAIRGFAASLRDKHFETGRRRVVSDAAKQRMAENAAMRQVRFGRVPEKRAQDVRAADTVWPWMALQSVGRRYPPEPDLPTTKPADRCYTPQRHEPGFRPSHGVTAENAAADLGGANKPVPRLRR
jgi:hypothetical protein